jgi:CrcB protein
VAAVWLGGMLGALARTGLDDAFPAGAHSWPWATFAVNLLGTLILGAIVSIVLHRRRPSLVFRPFLGAGFCGALTTFSTVQIEAIRLARAGEAPLAAGYLAASIVCGLLAAVAGTQLVRRSWGAA